MKFVVAAYGSRGDVEPCVAVGRELLRRGHDVRMAVPPNMLGLIESAGLAAVACGPDSQEVEGFRRDLSKIQNPDQQSTRSDRACYPGLGREGHDAD